MWSTNFIACTHKSISKIVKKSWNIQDLLLKCQKLCMPFNVNHSLLVLRYFDPFILGKPFAFLKPMLSPHSCCFSLKPLCPNHFNRCLSMHFASYHLWGYPQHFSRISYMSLAIYFSVFLLKSNSCICMLKLV